MVSTVDPLEQHHQKTHNSTDIPSYHNCDQTSTSENLSSLHNSAAYENDISSPQESHRSSIPSHYLSPICQYDGADDDLLDTPLLITSKPVNDVGVPISMGVATGAPLQANYQLNQQKQIKKLVRDTRIPDFEMTCNDNDRNVNIQCSTGFYEAVAKPAISSLSTGFKHTVHGVTITCSLIRSTKDLNNSIPGLLLRFELFGDQLVHNPVPLSVHLHSSQRKIQLQGGVCMSDQTTAPVWFVENLLKDMLVEQANTKKYNIDEINKLVSSTVTRSYPRRPVQENSSCNHCKKKFSASAKPVPCPRCSLPKHSTKCKPCPLNIPSTNPASTILTQYSRSSDTSPCNSIMLSCAGSSIPMPNVHTCPYYQQFLWSNICVHSYIDSSNLFNHPWVKNKYSITNFSQYLSPLRHIYNDYCNYSFCTQTELSATKSTRTSAA